MTGAVSCPMLTACNSTRCKHLMWTHPARPVWCSSLHQAQPNLTSPPHLSTCRIAWSNRKVAVHKRHHSSKNVGCLTGYIFKSHRYRTVFRRSAPKCEKTWPKSGGAVSVCFSGDRLASRQSTAHSTEHPQSSSIGIDMQQAAHKGRSQLYIHSYHRPNVRADAILRSADWRCSIAMSFSWHQSFTAKEKAILIDMVRN